MHIRLCVTVIAAICGSGSTTVPVYATDGSPTLKVANTPAVSNLHEATDGKSIVPDLVEPRDPDPKTALVDARGEGDDDALTIVLGGDLGLSGSRQPVQPEGALRHGVRYRWSELTAGIAPLINGDLNFANLETVVTDSNKLSAASKAFNFRSHPVGIRHLVRLGFNVVSTANNHAIDYGQAGIRETLRHLEALEGYGLKAWPGIGMDREHASRPVDVVVKGARVRISAIGIGGNGIAESGSAKRAQHAGMLAYNSAVDFRETVSRLAEAEGDLRILSVHYGSELQVRSGFSDVRKLRDEAAKGAGIDIVVGHHAHVAAGVQDVNGKLVFYGLGNLLHPGMQDMGRFGVCRDYGLMIRLHFVRGAGGRFQPRAIEAIPLQDMHQLARPMPGESGRMRIDVLNYLATGLDDTEAGAKGVRFSGQPDGSGLHCMRGAVQPADRIGAMCRDWRPPDSPSASVSRRISYACGGSNLIARKGASGESYGAYRPSRPHRAKKSSRKKKVSNWSFFSTW